MTADDLDRRTQDAVVDWVLGDDLERPIAELTSCFTQLLPSATRIA